MSPSSTSPSWNKALAKYFATTKRLMNKNGTPFTGLGVGEYYKRDCLQKRVCLSSTHRSPRSNVRAAQARYASDSHVTVTYATLNGVEMRIERSKMWGVITKPCKEVI